MRLGLLSLLAASLCFAQFPTDSRGIIQTGLPAAQDNLLGPLTQSGTSPWIFGDLAETGVADSMTAAALSLVPALGTACTGTVSFTAGNNFVTTTADMTTCVAGSSSGWMVFTWNSIDGTGTGRLLCPVASTTSTQINCGEYPQEPSFSGATAYTLPSPVTEPNGNVFDFQQWTTENPSTVWNYYDVSIALYRLYYRTGNTAYLTDARQYADIQWQWVLDHGYRSVSPRASAMLGQFFRALDGNAGRLPGLYNWIAYQETRWNPTGCPNCDNREDGYETLDIALGAKVDTDPTRHTQYCSWLSSFVTTWNGKQASDGSFPENGYSMNYSYVTAPKAFTLPIQYGAAPWREFINAKALEAAYESLNDTTSQGCNNTTLAASTLTTITNLITWLNNYGRDTSDRGVFYEVNYQSADESTVYHPAGTVSATLTSTAITGVGTGWQTAGYCDGTHFIGIESSSTVYKIASCTSDTAATLSVAFGLYSEAASVSGSLYSTAPAASTGCHSSATYCFGSTGDRNLTRPICGAIGWLYAQTHNQTYLNWADECASATLGGPTAGLTSAVNMDSATLPCSGQACDGYVNDMVIAAPSCTVTGGVAPCVYGTVGPYSPNTGKNFGEAYGAPGIDNELAWRNWFAVRSKSAQSVSSGSSVQ